MYVHSQFIPHEHNEVVDEWPEVTSEAAVYIDTAENNCIVVLC